MTVDDTQATFSVIESLKPLREVVDYFVIDTGCRNKVWLAALWFNGDSAA